MSQEADWIPVGEQGEAEVYVDTASVTRANPTLPGASGGREPTDRSSYLLWTRMNFNKPVFVDDGPIDQILAHSMVNCTHIAKQDLRVLYVRNDTVILDLAMDDEDLTWISRPKIYDPPLITEMCRIADQQ